VQLLFDAQVLFLAAVTGHVTGIARRDGTGDRASTSGHPSCGSIHICVWVADFMQTSCNRLIHGSIVHDSLICSNPIHIFYFVHL